MDFIYRNDREVFGMIIKTMDGMIHQSISGYRIAWTAATCVSLYWKSAGSVFPFVNEEHHQVIVVSWYGIISIIECGTVTMRRMMMLVPSFAL
jgi:hypothetical protein